MTIMSNRRCNRCLISQRTRDDIILLLLLSSSMIVSTTYAGRQQVKNTVNRIKMYQTNQSHPSVAGYTPAYPMISSQSRVDLDIQKMDEYLRKGYLNQSYDIYQYGAYANMLAHLKISINAKTRKRFSNGDFTVVGTASNGQVISGVIKEIENKQITIRYISSTSCAIGGLLASDRDFNGCFTPTGTVTILDSDNKNLTTIRYTQIDHGTVNSISTLSTKAKTRMKIPGSGRFFPLFQLYNDYYGVADYANRIIEGLYFGTNVNFPKHKININLNSYTDVKTKAAGVTLGSAILNIAMYSLQNLNLAVLACNINDTKQDLIDIDASVAYYVGSQPNASSLLTGYLMYTIANKHCETFKTCGLRGDETKGLAKVNQIIMNSYSSLKALLYQERCPATKPRYERIDQYYFVPLIQGLLHIAYLRSNSTEAIPKLYIQGTMYTLSLLPLVNNCSSADADTLYNNMIRIPNNTLSYSDVKKALENNYRCMSGITCTDVGGVWDLKSNAYFPNAGPCNDDPSLSMAPSVYVNTAPQSVAPSKSSRPTPPPSLSTYPTITTPPTMKDSSNDDIFIVILPPNNTAPSFPSSPGNEPPSIGAGTPTKPSSPTNAAPTKHNPPTKPSSPSNTPPTTKNTNITSNVNNSINTDNSKKPGLAVGMTFLSLAIILGVAIVIRRRRSHNDKRGINEAVRHAEDESYAQDNHHNFDNAEDERKHHYFDNPEVERNAQDILDVDSKSYEQDNHHYFVNPEDERNFRDNRDFVKSYDNTNLNDISLEDDEQFQIDDEHVDCRAVL